jgi:NAD(P)-dependent dehydrogenase (short-subunit alcohol dehydrogenase family)
LLKQNWEFKRKLMGNDSVSMNGKICMVTGATDGLGQQTARVLLEKGATVVAIGRNPQKIEQTLHELKQKTGSDRLEFLQADFANPEQIRQLAARFQAQYDRLDVLINNAGTVNMSRQETQDGLEMMFAVNHLGYFLLTMLLLDTLKASVPSRIINVASDAHGSAALNSADLQSEHDFSGLKVYGRSKLANIYFTYELARRLEGSGVTVNVLHPGFVATNLGADNMPVIGGLIKRIINLSAKDVSKGVETIVYLATSPEVEGVNGKYFVDCQPKSSSPVSYDETAAQQLWAVSAEMVGLNA